METYLFSTVNWENLENAWRARVELKQQAYRKSAARYGQLLAVSDGITPDPKVVTEARDEAAKALKDFVRALKMFTALIVSGKAPDEWFACEAST
jgi:hypothetical protein